MGVMIVHIFRDRNLLTGSLGTDVKFPMLIFLLLWINLLLEKVKGITLGFVCGAFLGAVAIALRLG